MSPGFLLVFFKPTISYTRRLGKLVEQERIANCCTFSGQKTSLYAATWGRWFPAVYTQIDLLPYSLKPKVDA